MGFLWTLAHSVWFQESAERIHLRGWPFRIQNEKLYDWHRFLPSCQKNNKELPLGGMWLYVTVILVFQKVHKSYGTDSVVGWLCRIWFWHVAWLCRPNHPSTGPKEKSVVTQCKERETVALLFVSSHGCFPCSSSDSLLLTQGWIRVICSSF